MFRELSCMLDDDDHPLSLHIHNRPKEWTVHVYSSTDESPIVRSGTDLSELIASAVEAYKRRKIVMKCGRS